MFLSHESNKGLFAWVYLTISKVSTILIDYDKPKKRVGLVNYAKGRDRRAKRELCAV